MAAARLLDTGRVSAVRSQTVYHAVAECARPSDPVTLAIPSPDRPYVSIGYHQQADREIDLDYCRESGIPVIRRMIGGGAVLLDENQLFFHLVIPEVRVEELRLPLRFADRYRPLSGPAIEAYRRLGIEARFRPPNDIQVNGRKIGGTGTATIGDAFVFVGSMMLDFDHAVMVRVLRLPDQAMRDEVRRSMEQGVTSLRHETGSAPDREQVKEALLESFRERLGLDLFPGELTAAERELVEDLDEEFQREEWLHHVSWSDGRPRNLNVNGAVRYLEAAETDASGTLRFCIRLVDGRIDDLLVGGDFAAASGDAIRCLRASLAATAAAPAELEARIRQAWASHEGAGAPVDVVSALTRKLVAAAAT